MRYGKMKNKGSAIILVAGITLGFLLVFAVLAIDFSRMYYVRGELQSAADSAALAGADKLSGATDSSTASFREELTRQEAWKFACKNRAAQAPVYLSTNVSTNCDAPPSYTDLNGSSNLETGDIILGDWRATAPGSITCATGWVTFGSGYFCRANGSTGLIINAVRVVAKRTGETPGMPAIGFLFPKLIPGLQTMGVKQEAIATRPPTASSFVAVGGTFCSSFGSCIYPAICTLSSPRQLQAAPTTVPPYEQFGWTSLLQAPGSASEVSAKMCNNSPSEQICDSPGIYGIPGAGNSVLQNYESLMFDPNFDRSNKEINALGIVTSWWVMIPRTIELSPMSGPDPQSVAGYTLMRVIAVCASGTNGCRGYGDPPGLCGPHGTYPNGTIVIDRISCIDCGSPALGLKTASLVK